MAESMLQLIQRQGYSGTGITEVSEHADAPKGSLYFHFPDGKEGIGLAAVHLAATQFTELIAEALRSSDGPASALQFAIEALSRLVSDSDYQLGCPVSVVTLEMGGASEGLRDACASAFTSWIDPISDMLTREGFRRADATNLATVIIASIEGAVIMARASRSTQPLDAAAAVLTRLVEPSTAVGATA